LLAETCAREGAEKGFGSVLLGSTSESDEYGDVPIFLADSNSEIKEAEELKQRVARELGIDHRRLLPYTLSSSSSKAVQTVFSKVYPDDGVGENHTFKAEGLDGGKVLVLAFWKRLGGWIGLVGAGVWT
jgi:hypothetical protein